MSREKFNLITRSKSNMTNFMSFNARSYLKEYYSRIAGENRQILTFLVSSYSKMDKVHAMLEFGGGHTIYPLIAASKKVDFIHFSDYLDSNLEEVCKWKLGTVTAFSWGKFVRETLKLEGKRKIKHADVAEREALIRELLVKIVHCNAFKKDPISKDFRGYYDLINVNFVAESITNSKKVWRNVFANICSMLKKDGTLIMSSIKDANYYKVGKKVFPAVKLDEQDIIQLMKNFGFNMETLVIKSVQADVIDENSPKYEGYKGLIFVKAIRR